MRTTITLRDDLLKLARHETREKSITAAVNRALDDWAHCIKVKRIKQMAGKVHFDMNWRKLETLEMKETWKLHGKRSR